MVSIIATPFLIRQLGPSGYGLLALVNAIGAYVLFADFGMGVASTTLGGRAFAKGSPRTEAAIVVTAALIAMAATGAIALLLGFVAKPLAYRVLSVPDEVRQTAVACLQIVGLGAVGRAVAGVLNTPLLSRGRFGLQAWINSGSTIVQTALAPLAALLFGGVMPVVLLGVITALATTVVTAHIAWKILPELTHARPDPREFGNLLRNGASLTTVGGLGVLLAGLEKPVLGLTSSITAVAAYSVAFSVASLLTIASLALANPLLAVFSRLQAGSESDRIGQLYWQVLSGTLIWLPPALICLGSNGNLILTLWAGSDLGPESTPAYLVLLIGLAVNTLALVPFQLLIAAGRSRAIATLCAVELPIYGLSLLVLARSYGAVGAALAWTLRAAVEYLVLSWLVQDLAGCSRVGFGWRRLLGFAGATSIALLPIATAQAYNVEARAQLVTGLASAGIYVLLAWGLVLRQDERRQLGNLLRQQVGTSTRS